MRIVGAIWFLFGLLVVAAVLESAITYAPSAQHKANVVFGVTAALAVVCGLAAIWLTIKRKRNPGSPRS